MRFSAECAVLAHADVARTLPLAIRRRAALWAAPSHAAGGCASPGVSGDRAGGIPECALGLAVARVAGPRVARRH